MQEEDKMFKGIFDKQKEELTKRRLAKGGPGSGIYERHPTGVKGPAPSRLAGVLVDKLKPKEEKPSKSAEFRQMQDERNKLVDERDKIDSKISELEGKMDGTSYKPWEDDTVYPTGGGGSSDGDMKGGYEVQQGPDNNWYVYRDIREGDEESYTNKDRSTWANESKNVGDASTREEAEKIREEEIKQDRIDGGKGGRHH